MIEMFTGSHPWPNLPNSNIAAIFAIARCVEGPPTPPGASDSAKDFFARCFRVNPSERATATALLEHPWVIRTDAAVKEAKASRQLQHSV